MLKVIKKQLNYKRLLCCILQSYFRNLLFFNSKKRPLEGKIKLQKNCLNIYPTIFFLRFALKNSIKIGMRDNPMMPNTAKLKFSFTIGRFPKR